MKGLKIFESGLMTVYENKLQENMVNARDLHKILKINTRFNDWITRRISEYEFAEGKDFYSFLSKTKGRPSIEYSFKIDSAKELAMIENNEIGRMVRRYFIEVEKRWREEIERRNIYLEAKADFPEFTDAILSAHEEPRHYHFSNELDMINKIVTGMTAKQIKESRGLDKSVTSIRPYLHPLELSAIKALQRVDIGMILTVPDFQERKQKLTEYYNNRIKIKQLSA